MPHFPQIKILDDAPNDFYTSIAPIRMLALKTGGEEHKQTIFSLPDHAIERSQTAKSEWNLIQMEVVEFLRSRCFLKNQVTEEELHHYAGIFMVNGVSIGNPIKGSCYGKAIYPMFSVINHDCLANAKFKIDTRSWEINVKATRPIKKH